MSEQVQILEENPLDSVEEILAAHNWAFSRMNDDELMVRVSGRFCEYRLFFLWQEDMSAMQFCCQYDISIDRRYHDSAADALMAINENLWMGHFDLPRESGIPTFRQTCFFTPGSADSSGEQIERLVDLALIQCERYYGVFRLLAKHGLRDDEMFSLALMETAGES